LVELKNCIVESSVADAASNARYQFEREGYFCVDEIDSTPDALIFNRTITLRDSWKT
jgi:glutaminyl-tRNA synthetase